LEVPVGFLLMHKYVTLNDLELLFYVKFYFCAGISRPTVLKPGFQSLVTHRSRQHNRELTRKSTHINDSLFFIRMLYKDAY